MVISYFNMSITKLSGIFVIISYFNMRITLAKRYLCPPHLIPILILSCLGDYVSVTVWYDETVVVVGLAVKLAG